MSHTLPLTAIAMIAFAGNSILCRLALVDGDIDAASFTSIRVVSAAVFLGVLVWYRHGHIDRKSIQWGAVVSLALYMVTFAFAYLTLTTATGALLLFASAQFTMFAVALYSGERFSRAGWVGVIIAAAGMLYLLAPGVTAPPIEGALQMIVAGIAWGAYSLFGRSAPNPTVSTTWNFIFCIPLVLAVNFAVIDNAYWSTNGIALAATSGVIASGLGYVIWYTALSNLSAMTAATVQLSVPVLAAIGGVIVVSESPDTRLAVATAATLGGIAMVLWQQHGSQSQA